MVKIGASFSRSESSEGGRNARGCATYAPRGPSPSAAARIKAQRKNYHSRRGIDSRGVRYGFGRGGAFLLRLQSMMRYM